MHLWNVNALAEELRAGRISEKDQLKYFTLSGALSVWPLSQSASWAEYVTIFAMLAGGSVWCFRANERGDNRDFILRMTCLSIPIAVRILTLGAIIAGILAGIAMLSANLLFGTGWHDFRSFIHQHCLLLGWSAAGLLAAAFFTWLRHCLAGVSRISFLQRLDGRV